MENDFNCEVAVVGTGFFTVSWHSIGLNLLKIDLTETRSLPEKRRRAMLAPYYRDTLLCLT